MAEVTNELILEHLKRVQDRLSRLETGQTAIFEELRSHKSLIAGALTSQVAHESTTAGLTMRLDRIEARLDIREQ